MKIKYSSFAQLLSTVYPEQIWLPWRFESTPKLFWDQELNCKNFLNQISFHFKIKNLSDWYKIDQKVFQLNFRALIFPGNY